MRTRILLGLMAGAVAVLITVSMPSANGGESDNTFTVNKVVEGPVPPGTVFEVAINCIGQGASTMTFDEDGNPTSANSFEISPFTTCSATETEDGGAESVSYQCDVTEPTNNAPTEGDSQVECVDDQTVFFGDIVDASGTIT